MNWLKSLWGDVNKLHVTTISAGVITFAEVIVIGFFGRDWRTAGEIALAGVGTVITTSTRAHTVTNSIGIAPDATAQIPKQ